jgi:glycosyltransferase involved in cell wall biosynthesis
VNSTDPEISVVIPVRNGERYVSTLCSSLERQTLKKELFEIIFVDDGSTDQTPELLSAWVEADPTRRRLIQGNSKGPAAARNLGLREAKGAWVAFTDSDTMPLRNWLEQALAAGERRGVHALEGAVESWPPEAVTAYSHQIDSAEGGRYMTANMIYRRDLLERLRGFDERFEAPFLEDSDLAFRVLDAGFEIPYAPDVLVRHRVVARSLVEVHRSARKLRWLALLAAKHPDRYRTQIRPIMRPLSHVDMDVMLGLIAAAAVPRARGLSRLALGLVAVNGLRRGLGSGRVFSSPPNEMPTRAALALSLPVSKAFWWLEGCVRFRKAVW